MCQQVLQVCFFVLTKSMTRIKAGIHSRRMKLLSPFSLAVLLFIIKYAWRYYNNDSEIIIPSYHSSLAYFASSYIVLPDNNYI